jgi:hypothetical protein
LNDSALKPATIPTSDLPQTEKAIRRYAYAYQIAGQKGAGRTMRKHPMPLMPILALALLALSVCSCSDAMAELTPAVAQEMIYDRASAVAEAVASRGDQIVLVGEVEASRTGIAFSLENRADSEFSYGDLWDMAHYIDGCWTPVPHLSGAGARVSLLMRFWLQSGGINEYRQEWDLIFGELPPGRYMFILDGWLGGYTPNHDRVCALVEFTITEDSPLKLPPQ